MAITTLGCACVPVVAPTSTPDPAINDVRNPFSFNLTASRHTDQPFSASNLDDVFDVASRILQRRDFECPDVACPVTFARLGDITTFDTGSPIITSEAQLDAVFAEPGDIKIVTAMVGVCGVPNNGDMTTILGCASTGGSVVIIATADEDVWAHEWGHVQGLRHRDDCPRNLMHSFEVLTNAVNDSECNAFLTPTPQARLLGAPPVNHTLEEPPAAVELASPGSPADWINEWVPRAYLAGIPVSCVPHRSDALPAAALLEQLTSDVPAAYRANLVRALGLIGDPAACQQLMSRIENIPNVMTLDEFNVLAESLLALGRLAPADDSDSAIELLCDAATPGFWTDKAPRLRMSESSVRDVSAELARVAVAALGLCDHSAARQRLAELSALATQGRFTDPWMADQLFEAMARSDGATDELRTVARQARYR